MTHTYVGRTDRSAEFWASAPGVMQSFVRDRYGRPERDVVFYHFVFDPTAMSLRWYYHMRQYRGAPSNEYLDTYAVTMSLVIPSGGSRIRITGCGYNRPDQDPSADAPTGALSSERRRMASRVAANAERCYCLDCVHNRGECDGNPDNCPTCQDEQEEQRREERDGDYDYDEDDF